MSGIAEAMAGMASGKRHGGISDGMEGKGQHKPQHDGGGIEEHLKAIHEKTGGGKHMHVQHHEHDGSYTTHHVTEDGKVEGPHEHANLEELKNHQDKFFNEEEHEGGGHSSDSEPGLM
jgi:hypothetical protein